MREGADPVSGCQRPYPSCLHGQAGQGPCHRPYPYPQTAPFLGGFKGASPSSALALLPPPPRSNACQLGLATTGALSWEHAGWEMGPRDLAQKQVRVRGSQRKAKKVRLHESKGKRGPQPSVSPQAL